MICRVCRRGFLLAVVLLPIACQSVLGDEGLAVRSMKISGNQNISSRKLRRLMITQARPWYGWLPFVNPRPFDPGAFDEDLRRIKSFYEDQGYYTIGVSARIHRRGKGVDLVMEVVEANLTRLQDVLFDGLDSLHAVDKAGLLRRTALRPGRAYRRRSLEPDKALIVDYLQNRGYPYADISASVLVKPEEGGAHVALRVAPGPRATFGKVRVTGNVGVSASTVQRGLDFRPGGPYRIDRLLSSQRRIYRSGAFRAVTVRPDLSDSVRTSVETTVSVQERPFNHTRLGLGYDTDESLRGSLAWGHRNFLGGARSLSVTGRASGILMEGELGFRQPFIIDSRTDLELNAFLRRLREPGIRTTELGGSLGLAREFARHLVTSLHYEQKQIKAGRDTLLFNVRSSLLRDTRNDIFDPETGSFYLTSAEKVFVQRSKNFVRITAEGRFYRRLVRRLTFAVRGFGGGIRVPRGGGIVTSERFFAGGAVGLRGWGLQEFGPGAMEGRFVPSGGKFLAEGSLELRFRPFGRMGLAAFIDFGNIGDDLSVFDYAEFAYSVGGGFRYKSPIGPIRIDLGYKARDPFHSRRNFGLRSYSIHFSLGQAF